MIKMSKATSLTYEEAHKRAVDYFVRREKLDLVEAVVHMHGRDGAAEVRVAGERLIEDGNHVSEKTLERLSDFARETLHLEPVYELLHIHPAHRDVGHIMIKIGREKPTDVEAEGQELEKQVSGFLESLPNA